MAASIEDVAAIALGLPEVAEDERHGNLGWSVAGKGFAWIRAFSKADIKRFGDAGPPAEPILAVMVADLGEKEALLAANQPGFFTIEHFNNYPAVLIELRKVGKSALRLAITDAWLACAPARLATEHMDSRPGARRARS